MSAEAAVERYAAEPARAVVQVFTRNTAEVSVGTRGEMAPAAFVALRRIAEMHSPVRDSSARGWGPGTWICNACDTQYPCREARVIAEALGGRP